MMRSKRIENSNSSISPYLYPSGTEERIFYPTKIDKIIDHVKKKIDTSTSVHNICKQVYNKWIELLLEKQYENENDGINRGYIVEEMKIHDLPWRRILAFTNCHRLSRSVYCPDCGYTRYIPYSCNDRACTICSKNRSKRIVRKYKKPLSKMRNPKLLSVTVGHIPIHHPDVLTYWRNLFYKLIRKLDKKLVSGFSVLEFSLNNHIHFHAIIDTPHFLPQRKLSEMWHKISGRYVIDIRRTNPKTAMYYIIKYCTKPPDFFDIADLVFYIMITRGRRLLATYGKLFRIETLFHIPRLCLRCGSVTMFFWRGEYVPHDFLLKQFGSWDRVP